MAYVKKCRESVDWEPEKPTLFERIQQHFRRNFHTYFSSSTGVFTGILVYYLLEPWTVIPYSVLLATVLAAHLAVEHRSRFSRGGGV